MRTSKIIIALVSIAVLIPITSCDSLNEKITVSLYEGSDLLEEPINIKKGTKMVRPTYLELRDDDPFIDWYDSDEYITPFVFTKTLESDTNIYGRWESTPVIDYDNPPSSISISIENDITSLQVGLLANLKVTVEPANSSKHVNWTTSDNGVAIVHKDGVLDAISEGEFTITATSLADSNISDSMTFTIDPHPNADNFPSDYYQNIAGKRDSELVSSLRNIVSDMTAKSYEDAKSILAESDRETIDGETYVRGIYDGDKLATTWVVGTGAWQREHVWPNGRLGIARVGESTKNQGTDLHNLRAISGNGVNQSRSDRYFDNKKVINGDGSNGTVGTEAYYPGDSDKGDVARILFYMVIRYDFLALTDNKDALENYTAYNMLGAKMGLLSALLEWHKEDPVDDFEINRQSVIFDKQKNRNPFIDRPELVDKIDWYSV